MANIVARDGLAHITLDRAADETLILASKDVKLNVDVDLSMVTVRFIVKNFPDLTFEPSIDVDDPKKRVLEFDQSYTAKLGSKPREYMIEAVYEDGKIDVIRRGTLTAIGWVA